MNSKEENINLISYYYSEFSQLVKMRLSLTVVFSSLLSFMIAGGLTKFGWVGLGVLFLGGFLITAASNIINQVLEKDYDLLMERTKNRPIATKRISVSTGVLIAGLFLVIGLFILLLFNPIASFIGSLAFVLYAFVYTPLKRVGISAVYIGGIAGALPTMIGVVAVDGELTSLAISLFSIQFCWQLPHFWAIAWLAFEDYKKAGYQFLPTDTAKPTNVLGRLAMTDLFGLFPIIAFMFWANQIGMVSLIIGLALTFIYLFLSYRMWKYNDRPTALKVMFFSFFYLPVILFSFYIETLF